MSQLTKTDSTNDYLSDDVTESIKLPRFTFSKKRWATTREENVQNMRDFWKDNPNHVMIFEDPKFEDEPLAMLRHDKLEELIAPIRDLASGQTAIRLEIETVSKTAKMVEHTVEALIESLENTDKDSHVVQALRMSIETLTHSVSKISATLVLARQRASIPPTPLSEEELALLDEEDDD